MAETLLLVDGHSQAYRAYFGLKTPLTTRAGEPTSAVFGFARKLFSVLKEFAPDYVAVAFDTGDTWRHGEFSDYKATRDHMPDDMRTQMARIEQFLRAFNIPVLTYPNYEADDILGTIAKQAAAQGVDVLILTGDRDLFQLIDEHVRILYTSGGPNPQTSVYGLPELQERYGLTPEQFVEMKALVGDNSDNIPGVAGVGEKTAIKFLSEYGTVEGLYEHVDRISGPKTRQNLIDAKSDVERNRRLMTIVTDLPMHYNPDAFRTRDYDRQAVLALLQELEFHSLVRELPEPITSSPAALSSESDEGQLALFGAETNGAQAQQSQPSPQMFGDYVTVTTVEQLDALVEALRSATQISFDVETTSTDAMSAVLVGLGVAWETGKSAYLPVGHSQGTQLTWDEIKEALQPFFADPNIVKMAHNGKYDLTVCLRYGLEIDGPLHDTMVMAWLLDPGSRALGLKALAGSELGWTMTEITELIGSGRKQITIDQVAIELASPYCCADVDSTLRLFDIFGSKLREAGLWELYDSIERPLLPVLTDMEMTGVRLDVDFLREMSAVFAKRLQELESELFEIVGHPFNLRSTQQLSQVLFEELRFPARGLKRTSSGHVSTAAGTLEYLATLDDDLTDAQKRALSIILEQRQVEKLRGTYVDALPNLVNPETGRVHTSYSQTGAVTGRMSSSNPNLQNIPIRTELGREIRRAFVAPPGWKLISADYSQVELRILAHVTGEQGLIDAFLADQDIHAATGARLFSVPIEEVNRSQRSLAKTINFATLYGISAFGLSNRTDMSRPEAERFLRQYFQTYPKVQKYIDDTIKMANEKGYVETLLGRRRFFPELKTQLHYNQRQAAERAAVNSPIQGTAADIMKIAMVRLHDKLRESGLQARMLLQVHDELVLESPAEECVAAAKLLCDVMESAYEMVVPLKVDVESGVDWYNLEPVEIA